MEWGRTTTLTGSSGRQYEFNVFERETRFRPKPGIYVMGRQRENAANPNELTFCFVGESANLQKRPFNPDKQACFASFGVSLIFLLEEFDETLRREIVQDLVSAYAPRCNTI